MSSLDVYNIVHRFHFQVSYASLEISPATLEDPKSELSILLSTLRNIDIFSLSCMYDRFCIWSAIFDGIHKIIIRIWSPDTNYIRFRWMTLHHHWFIADLPFTLKDIYDGILGKSLSIHSIDAPYFSDNDPRSELICDLRCVNKQKEGVCKSRRCSIGVLKKNMQCVYNLPMVQSPDYYKQISRFPTLFDAVVTDVFRKLSNSYAQLFFLFRF
ncbi:MAG: hypothetical protein N4A37_06045 [Prolixibacteraceae bacterium]|jgi:hypothetical protein|nr:hypothetical protein [Prolixibacteraceae bacterium]